MLRDLRHPGKAAHSTYGWVKKKTWDFAPMQWFLQAWTELWAAAGPDPPLPIPIPARCNGTHSSYAGQGHPGSSSQLRADSSHALSIYFNREVLMLPSTDPQSLQKGTFLLSLYSVHYKHTRKNTSSHIPQQQGPAFSVTPLQAVLLLLSTTAALNNLSTTTAINLSVKRGWTKCYFYKCFPN